MSTDNPYKPNDIGAVNQARSIRFDIQGLRAIAVFAVIFYHADDSFLKAGFIGVDIFFVISGFIITDLLAKRAGKFSFYNFYISRIKRIFPAYFVMLVVVCLLSAVLFLPYDFKIFQKSFSSAATFTSNQYFAGFGSYFGPRVDELPFLHTWSLAIEMQFYLLYPMLVFFTPQRWRLCVFALLTFGLFIFSGYQTSTGAPDNLYFSLVTRMPEFLLGAVVALSIQKRELSIVLATALGGLGAVMLFVSLIVIDRQHFPGFWSILPCVGAGLLIVARRGPANAILATRPMVWFGSLSYSLYLWHWPILAFIRYYTGHYTLSASWLVMFVSISLLLAWLSYRFVETPARNAIGIWRQAPRWAALAAVVALAIWGGHRLNASLIEPLPVEMTRYANPKLICHGSQVGDCKRGKSDADPSVLVIGDSHAAQLNYFFDQVGTRQGVAYRVLTASSCVPIPGFDVERLPAWAHAACRAQIEAVSHELPNFDQLIIAGMWQYQMQSQAFAKTLGDFLYDSVKGHKRVLVLAQVPMFETDVQRVRRFTELGLPAPLAFNRQWQAANQQVKEIVQRTPGVRFLDFSNSEFFASAPYQHGTLIYRDRHHLNEVGANRYGQYAAEQLQRIFDQPQSNVSLKP
ncbi:acyltransferase family protein [Pseudomonas putida]|uniref:acyltransferase family protein n=1 Tax=Pseudomonas putida TaxID=303 RepID=UPI00345D4594